MNIKIATAIVLTSLPSLAQAKSDPFAAIQLPKPVQPPAIQASDITLASPTSLPSPNFNRATVNDLNTSPNQPIITTIPPKHFHLRDSLARGSRFSNPATSILKPILPILNDELPTDDQKNERQNLPSESSDGTTIVEKVNPHIQKANLPLVAGTGLAAYFGWRAFEGVVTQVERDNPSLIWGQCKAKAFLGKVGGQLGCKEPEPLPDFPSRMDLSTYDWQVNGFKDCLEREERQFDVRSNECDEELKENQLKLKAEEQGTKPMDPHRKPEK